MKKIVLIVFVVLLATAVIVRPIRSVAVQETIYIRSDGSIDPPTAPIDRDGDIYTFTDSIYCPEPRLYWIVLERNNILVDGAGYTVQGSEGSFPHGNGIGLLGRSNVTIKNMEIEAFDYAIALNNSSNNSIYGNNITTNEMNGVWLHESSNNSIYGNNIKDNLFGIWLQESSNNSIYGNNIKDNYIGVRLTVSSGNMFDHNNFVNNIQQVSDDSWEDPVFPPSINVWNDGYPSGGNYWGDYEEKYPGAEEIDGSGIWNTPYVIDENNQDKYPIVPEFPTWTSMLIILIILTVAIATYKRRLPKTTIH